jgi:hypothetical protein
MSADHRVAETLGLAYDPEDVINDDDDIRAISFALIVMTDAQLCSSVGLPEPESFMQLLMAAYGVTGDRMNMTTFSRLLDDILKMTTGASEAEEDDSHDHSHSRRAARTTAAQGCYNAAQLLQIFSIPSALGLTATQLQQVSGALVQIVTSSACVPQASASSRCVMVCDGVCA